MGNKNTKFNEQHHCSPHNNNMTESNSLNKINGNGSSNRAKMKNSATFTSAHEINNNINKTQTLNRNNKYNDTNSNNKSFVTNLVASPLTSRQKNMQNYNKQRTGEVINFNQAMKTKQNDLTNIIKQIDSNQPSYHTNSKLYKPNSFLMASNTNNDSQSNKLLNQTTQSNHHVQQDTVTKKKHASLSSSSSSKSSSMTSGSPMQNLHKQNVNSNTTSGTLPNVNKKNFYSTKSPPQSPNKHVKISPEIVRSTKSNSASSLNTNNTNNNSTTNSNTNSNNKHSFKNSSSKLTKKFGLSPRFKRKIVETIKHGVQSSLNHCDHSNQKFNQSSIFTNSRLFQALQSQWNLFSSERFSKNDFDDEGELKTKHRRHHHRTETQTTHLSTSLQHNSFRYASRRKYKTQSLANPYRHANTNYPVYIHEALFMPEFSVKGQVTEADFEILDVISRGAFGHVIKVKKKINNNGNGSDVEESNKEREQIYAMKIMWKSQVIRDRALQQVKDEVTIATNCVDNPLIVKTWFYWQSKRFLYIITDYVENGELLSLWLKVHHFPERLVIIYAVEMCLILDYLHKRGIIYRDIKMENILLDQRGHVQLIDFGLSKWVKMGDRTGTICGTIQYMAPEILGVEPYDHAVDWWSLGILIYALLSGEYPLNAAKDHIQMNERVSKHVFELDRSRGNYTDEACDLVRKLLRKNPHRRLKSLDEIKREPFFKKEIDMFVYNYLDEERLHERRARRKKNKIVDDDDENTDDEDEIIDELNGEDSEVLRMKKQMIIENFWNPYVIMQSYSPLQLLVDEIYALKQKQLEKKNQIKNKLEQQKLIELEKRLQPIEQQNPDNESLTLSQATVSLPPSPLSPQFIDADSQDQEPQQITIEKIKLDDEINSSFTKF